MAQWLTSLTTTEMRIRIEKARTNFIKTKSVLCIRDLNLGVMIRWYVFTTLLYGSKPWTRNAATTGGIEAIEMWTNRTILKLSWADHVRNIEIMRKMENWKKLLKQSRAGSLNILILNSLTIRGEKYATLKLKLVVQRSVGRRRDNIPEARSSFLCYNSCDDCQPLTRRRHVKNSVKHLYVSSGWVILY